MPIPLKALHKAINTFYAVHLFSIFLLQVGEKYALENEEELKDKMNFEELPSYRLPTGNHSVTVNTFFLFSRHGQSGIFFSSVCVRCGAAQSRMQGVGSKEPFKHFTSCFT